MAIYTCPTCGEKMERDLSLFMDHTDKHIVDEVKKLHPAWITDDGFCAKCLDYYKRARLGEAPNLDAAGARQRLALGMLGFGFAVLVSFWFLTNPVPRGVRLALFPLLFAGFLGIFQSRQKFCVVIAQKQTDAIRRRASKTLSLVAALSALLTAVVFMIPG